MPESQSKATKEEPITLVIAPKQPVTVGARYHFKDARIELTCTVYAADVANDEIAVAYRDGSHAHFTFEKFHAQFEKIA